MADKPYGQPTTLYGVVIHDAISAGNLSAMKKLEKEAEKHVAEVSAALKKLKAAIAKSEKKG